MSVSLVGSPVAIASGHLALLLHVSISFRIVLVVVVHYQSFNHSSFLHLESYCGCVVLSCARIPFVSCSISVAWWHLALHDLVDHASVMISSLRVIIVVAVACGSPLFIPLSKKGEVHRFIASRTLATRGMLSSGSS
jgi:hypothetical protein